MPEIGQSSRTTEDEVFIDILVDTEQLRTAEPEVEIEGDPEEDRVVDSDGELAERVDPGVGRVSRPYSDAESEGGSPVSYTFGNDEDEVERYASPEELPTENYLVGQLADKNLELKEKVKLLEEQNQIHHDMEGHYKSLVYQLLGENIELTERQLKDGQKISELEEKVQRHDSSVAQIGSLAHQLVARNTKLWEKLEESELQKQQLQMEKQAIEGYWQEEMKAHNEMEAQLNEVKDRVSDLEDEVCGSKRKIDRIFYACHSSYDRMRNRVFYSPVEEGLTRRTISRGQVMGIYDEEYEDAVYRGMHRY